MLSDKSKLAQVVEATLFVSGQGIEIKDIAEKLDVEEKQIKKVIEELKSKHVDDGINIITYKNSVQMCSNPEFAEDIATVLNPIREKQLTKAALETAAIIAYKQPVTKLDIEQVRGVNSDYAVQVLTSFNLIEVVGRKDAIGKPLLYGTTDEFLKRFELQSIEDLPDYDELLERIKVLYNEDKKTDALYGSTEIIPEEELADSKNNLQQQTKLNVEADQSVLNSKKQQNSAKTREIVDNIISPDRAVDNKKQSEQFDEDDKNLIQTLYDANTETSKEELSSSDIIGDNDFDSFDTL
ncbi:MAG: SMC-Scp complex subunit ScpB [Clostridia bacterium]|nr:SMC-Scp complex subunit ScpB [Clostridia bacterium]